MAIGFSQPPSVDAADAGAYANLPSNLQAGDANFLPAIVAAAQNLPPQGASAVPPPAAAPAPQVDPNAQQPPATAAAPQTPTYPIGPAAAQVHRMLGIPDPNAPQGASGAPAGYIAPPTVPGRPGAFEAIGDLLLGGLPTYLKSVGYQRDLTNYSNQAGVAALQRGAAYINQNVTNPRERAAALQDIPGYMANVEKAFEPVTVPGGQTRLGAGMSPYTAPLLTTNNGRFFTQTPDATTKTGSAGPTYTAPNDSGVSVDTTGQAPPVTTPAYQHFAPAENHGFVQANMPGQPGAPAGTLGAGPAITAGPRPAVAQALSARWTASGVPAGDQAALLATGQIEGGLNPAVRNNGSSTGLFQFQPQTFKAVGGTDITDPGQQADAAAKLWAANRTTLTAKLGRPPTDAELYLAHQQGAGGASALVQADPNANAIQALVGAGVYSNPAQARRAITNNGGTRAMTAGQFVQTWGSKFGQALGSVGGGNDGAAPPTGANSPTGAPQTGPLGTETLSGGKTYSAPQQIMGPDGKTPLPGLYVTGPDGKPEHVEGTGMTPENAMAMGKSVRDDDGYKDAEHSSEAYKAMLSLAAQPPGGIRAYALRDTFGRTVNPQGAVRLGTIDAIKQSQGVPANIEAYFSNLKGDGDVPPQIVQQIVDAARPFADAHWQQANALNHQYARVAQKNGLDPDLATAPPLDRPQPFYVTPPPAAQRVKGQTYATPKGSFTWTGSGWHKN